MAENTRRLGDGTASLLRWLAVSDRPVIQVELAERTGLTQPAVSKALRMLLTREAVYNIRPGWSAEKPALLDQYVAGYASRLVDRQSCWYGLDSPREQAEQIAERIDDALLSGDAAADIVRPWRLPTVTIVYTNHSPADMLRLGFVESNSVATANLLVRPIPDRRLADESVRVGDVRVVPPLHLAADLVVLGEDRRDHAERILR